MSWAGVAILLAAHLATYVAVVIAIVLGVLIGEQRRDGPGTERRRQLYEGSFWPLLVAGVALWLAFLAGRA